MKFCNCSYCNDGVEVHHIKLHEKACALNPVNLKKICSYLKRGIVDTRLLKRASFYEWSIENRILTSITITNRFKLANWHQALIQLIVFGYLKGFIEYIYVEMLLAVISHGSMWLEPDIFRKAYNNARENDMRESGVDGNLYYNYYLLLIHILHRCNQDVKLKHESLDENKEIVDVYDATDFLLTFAPDVFYKRLELKLIGNDSIEYYLDSIEYYLNSPLKKSLSSSEV